MKNLSFGFFLIGLSTLIASCTYAFDTYEQSSLFYKMTHLRMESIAHSSGALILSEELLRVVQEVRYQQEAYNSLSTQFQNLSRHNQPAIMLEPAITEIERRTTSKDLRAIEKELKLIATEAQTNIIDIGNFD